MRCLFSAFGAKANETHSLILPSLKGKVFFFFWVIVSNIIIEGLSPFNPKAKNLYFLMIYISNL